MLKLIAQAMHLKEIEKVTLILALLLFYVLPATLFSQDLADSKFDDDNQFVAIPIDESLKTHLIKIATDSLLLWHKEIEGYAEFELSFVIGIKIDWDPVVIIASHSGFENLRRISSLISTEVSASIDKSMDFTWYSCDFVVTVYKPLLRDLKPNGYKVVD